MKPIVMEEVEQLEKNMKREQIWQQMKGHRIILAGNTCLKKSAFQENLAYQNTGDGISIPVTNSLSDIGEKDLVLLFAYPEKSEDMDELLQTLQMLYQSRPAAIALVSDNQVYGAKFGDQKPRMEHEIGYVCHARKEEQLPARLRMIENLCWRLAREEGFPVRVIRTDKKVPPDYQTQMIREAAWVLLHGKTGEVYNITSGSGEADLPISPLMPANITTDTMKVGQLCCFETI